MIIEELRLYKMNGDFLRLVLGENTTAGTITRIENINVRGVFKVEYDNGKRHSMFSGFNGSSSLYGPEGI